MCATKTTGILINKILDSLEKSQFRLNQRLWGSDYKIYKDNQDKVRYDAREILNQKIGIADHPKDGKQTPYHKHPVFTAQHATATCCRGCVLKWYKLPKGRRLTNLELEHFTNLVMAWLARFDQKYTSGNVKLVVPRAKKQNQNKIVKKVIKVKHSNNFSTSSAFGAKGASKASGANSCQTTILSYYAKIQT